ncbi:hypothetical protein LTR12_008928 [Friedmanniomyces endolithicus]|nr:hypothetical protein LTR74_000938 [Friedmanniomyces endolithicus]KAK1816675.1 hypothetical protein LTR12_008928 [Friedmanniomyces endolithicus]
MNQYRSVYMPGLVVRTEMMTPRPSRAAAPPPPPPPKTKQSAPNTPAVHLPPPPKRPVGKATSSHSSKWSTAGTVGQEGRTLSSGERTGKVVGRDMMPGETRYVTNEEWRGRRGRVVRKRTTVGTTRKEG